MTSVAAWTSEPLHRLGRGAIQRRHDPDRLVELPLGEQALAEKPPGAFPGERVGASRADRHADSQRLRQHERVARPRPGVARDPRFLRQARHGEAVNRDVEVDRMTSAHDRSRLGHLLDSSPQDFLQDFRRESRRRKRRERERQDRTRPHRVDVGESVGGGDLPEEKRVIHDGREEVHRLHENLSRPDPVDSRVVGMDVPYQQVRVRRGRKLREKRGKVELTDLAGSTRARRERRERGMPRFSVSHEGIMSRDDDGVPGFRFQVSGSHESAEPPET